MVGGARTSMPPRRERRRDRRARWSSSASIASVLGIALGLLIDWFPPAASTQADKIDTLWDVLIIASVPVFVLVTTVVALLGPGLPHAARARRTSTARRSTATRASRSSGPRSRRSLHRRRSCVYAYVVLNDIEKAPASAARRARRDGHRRAVRLDLRVQRGRQDASRPPALPARGRVGEVRRPVQGRHPRLLGAGLPHEDRRGPGHHDELPRHAEDAASAPTRSSAPSSAASATPSCARPRT